MVKDVGTRGELSEEGPCAGEVLWEADRNSQTRGLLDNALGINAIERKKAGVEGEFGLGYSHSEGLIQVHGEL